jgi:hypothetical protein
MDLVPYSRAMHLAAAKLIPTLYLLPENGRLNRRRGFADKY